MGTVSSVLVLWELKVFCLCTVGCCVFCSCTKDMGSDMHEHIKCGVNTKQCIHVLLNYRKKEKGIATHV